MSWPYHCVTCTDDLCDETCEVGKVQHAAFAPVYDRWGVKVFHGDNLDILRALPDCSVDSIVTDPPAGIGFLGRSWDEDRGGRNEWVAWLRERMVEALRVLKPGGHALVWAMPRSSHWTGLALEDAGFQLRDVVQHVFDTGFPAGALDVSKAIDRRGGNLDFALAREIGAAIREARESRGWRRTEADRHFCNGSTNWSWFEGRMGECRPPTPEMFAKIADEWPELTPWAEKVSAAQREVLRTTDLTYGYQADGSRWAKGYDITEPRTEAARKWRGWSTALKPAAETWWLCRRPPRSTVAQNVLELGTGALNIDACRAPDGSWPANVAKFPKAPSSERPMVNGEQHPTVKSVALCRHFVRLVTPPGGTVLDLFAGTGPVGQAARSEGMSAILIEEDAQSIGFIRARLDARPKTQAGNGTTQDDEPVDLLDLLGDAS